MVIRPEAARFYIPRKSLLDFVITRRRVNVRSAKLEEPLLGSRSSLCVPVSVSAVSEIRSWSRGSSSIRSIAGLGVCARSRVAPTVFHAIPFRELVWSLWSAVLSVISIEVAIAPRSVAIETTVETGIKDAITLRMWSMLMVGRHGGKNALVTSG